MKAMEIRKQFEKETGKKWMVVPVTHGQNGYASWDYQLWLEKNFPESTPTTPSAMEEALRNKTKSQDWNNGYAAALIKEIKQDEAFREDLLLLQRSILAADPRKEDILIKDLKKQIDKIVISFAELSAPVSEDGWVSKEAALFEHMKSVEYPAWGHEIVMLWCHDKQWKAGLRNYKNDSPSTFDGNTAYEAMFNLYQFCLKNGHINPLPKPPIH